MRKPSRRGLIGELRREMALFASLCLLILTLPIAYPIAQAHAASEPNGIICTQLGHDGQGFEQDHLPVEGPDDCPCATACALQGLFAKLAISGLSDATQPKRSDCAPSAHRDSPPPFAVSTCHRPPGRAPPLSI